jgi:UDP-N-acetylmuramate--alanine ligase
MGYLGNAWAGSSDLLVVEADESDGSLVRYAPAIGVLLNLDKDHKEIAELRALFDTFRARTREAFVVGEAANLAHLRPGAVVFGTGDAAASGLRGAGVRLDRDGSDFTVAGLPFHVPVPGLHNVENALAALAAGRAAGVPLAAMATPLARFRGVGRRFQSIGVAGGVEVIDDFAHNPAKLAAALATARLRGPRRILAVFQPHGYGPTRFLRAELVEAFRAALRPADRLWLTEIYYAGGTAIRDLSGADLVADLVARGVAAEFAPERAALAPRIAEVAAAGDLVLVMGARDPSLTELCHLILERIREAV